jgi:hypothetical protein
MEVMDAKITLSFDKNIIQQAKAFAEENNISLSRLTEFIYRQMTSEKIKTLDELPIADWVNMVAEERPEYGRPVSRKKMKSEFFDSKK